MKFLLFIYDPEEIIWEALNPMDDDIYDLIESLNENISLNIKEVVIRGSLGETLEMYVNISDDQDYDRILFYYDGNFWLDSLANNAFLTFVSENMRPEVGHHTHNLIDRWIKTPYEEGNGKKLFAEILHLCYKNLAGDILYEQDKVKTLEEKRAKIDEIGKFYLNNS